VLPLSLLLSTFDPKKIKKKYKKKIQNTIGYIGRKPRRLLNLVAKDQNDK
jgi:predicted phosphoadenosine phosphosulfate sulfurtransferase